MSFKDIPAGKKTPDDVYVIIENPARTPNIKYEVDKTSGAVFVDRFSPTMLCFPAHYGFINQTLSEDGDPVDAFVYTDIPVVPGAVIRARPIGVLFTEDESGIDPKVICVPVEKLDRRFVDVQELADLPKLFCEQLEHFYKHYKDLEPGKWVKISGWGDAAAAKKAITEGVVRASGAGSQ